MNLLPAFPRRPSYSALQPFRLPSLRSLQVGENTGYVSRNSYLIREKKIGISGRKKNGSLRGEDEINSNETNVTFSWMESKRKKDFVGGL